MIRKLLFAVVILFGQSVSAQSVSVRSGEHEEFTRFVIRIQPGTLWSLERSSRQAALKVALPNVRFDTSGVFERIPRTRVSDVVQTEPGAPLRFQLSCDCAVDAFVEGRNLLVVDVRDAPQSGFGLPLPVSPTSEFRFALGAAYRPVLTVRSIDGMEMPSPGQTPSVVLPLVPDSTILSTGQVAQSWQVIEKRNSSIAQYEDRLSQQIERAREQGLLDGDLTTTDPDLPVTSSQTQSTVSASEPFAATQANLSVSTAIDRDLSLIEEVLRANAPPQSSCLPQSEVAFHAWGDDRPFAEQISERRQALVEDLTDLSVRSVMSLVKTYLYFGFGSEARQTLATSPVATKQEAVLVALASLIDTGALQGDNPFSGQHSCDGDVALWAVYAEPTGIEDVNKPAVLRAVARLPLALREHIAPSVSRLFSEAGDVETAEAILRTLDRAIKIPGPAAILAQASTLDLRGNVERANESRATVASSGSNLSPKALVELINSRFALGQTVTPDVIDLVGGYVEQFERSELGHELQKAEVTALAMVGRFDDAIARLDFLAGQDAVQSIEVPRLNILQALTKSGSDIDFLHHALNLSEGREADVPEDLGNDMAERFLALGFSQPAIRLLSRTQPDGSGERRRMLKARAALAENLPHEAMIALLGVEGEEADRLRAEAMAQRQDYAQAAAILREVNDAEALPRVRWLAEDWQAQSSADDEYSVLSDIASDLRMRTEAIATAGTLENARALLGDSSQTRRDIDALLARSEIMEQDAQ